MVFYLPRSPTQDDDITDATFYYQFPLVHYILLNATKTENERLLVEINSFSRVRHGPRLVKISTEHLAKYPSIFIESQSRGRRGMFHIHILVNCSCNVNYRTHSVVKATQSHS